MLRPGGLCLSPESMAGHFLRGRVLMQLGREGSALEFAAAQKGMEGRLT